MRGHGGGRFNGAAVLEIRGDARRPEGVIADVRPDADVLSAPLHHGPYVPLNHGTLGQ